jgi:NAD(P)-dependent dehydrogenase (short-subunit alcohol dehydrogenase family)
LKEFKDRVAVVTGGASGIGRGIAERLAAEGMKVVLADIEEEALATTEREMKSKGATVLAVRCDVSKEADMEALAQASVDAFGAVHVLCNNAGVAHEGGPMWERTEADWQWVLGANLWSVIRGVRVFVPIMLEQGTEGHIVNTSSAAGLVSMPWMSIYNVTKHAVVTLSETLHQELEQTGAKLKVSVLCPAWVNTKLAEADRNRPAELMNPPTDVVDPRTEMINQALRGVLAAGISTEQVAEDVFGAIRDDRFYILPHPEVVEGVRGRMDDIVEGRNPTIQTLFS